MQIIKSVTKISKLMVLATIAVLFVGAAPAAALVAPYNAAPTAKISFTFDDGLQSALTQAAPALQAQGLSGTNYVITNCVGMSTTPNTCAADTDVPYMTWDQITTLQNTYGWEIGSHTASHPQLATDGLTDAQLAAELGNSKQALAAHGFSAPSFATPYGDYNNHVLSEIAKQYASHRGFHDVSDNNWSYNDYLLNDMQVQAGVTVAQVQAKIDAAIAAKQWLVLTFHEIRVNPSTNPADYQYSTANLSAIAAYVKSKQDAGQLKAINVNQGLVTSDVNLFANGGFDSGISGGWTTDAPTAVVANNANHGSYPNATNSVSVTAGTANVHLFSPKVTVSSTQTYLAKGYLNMDARTAGEMGYYVDEYNSSGNWVSGQWIKAQPALFTGEFSFSYRPTSATVTRASLQIYTTANSGIHAYLDNIQFFPLVSSGTTTPPPSNNLLPNSTFDSGVGAGWTTNNAAAFSADAANHGSPENAVNSVKLTAGTGNASLFAPQVGVAFTSNYTVNAYLNLVTRTNEEVAFYIDEYDASGSWVSGQYKAAKRTAGVENITFDYVPTSSAVKKAGLQIILVGNSGITGYLDNVTFLAPAGEAPTPPPTTPPTPPTPPSTTNFMPGGDFEGGLTSGWTTNDPANITADTANHGSPAATPAGSISLRSSTQNRHLFSPQISVDPTKSYSLFSYLNVTALASGEVGFYIDEYNAAGTWVSGQYKTGIRAVSAGDVSFTYTPSSATVAKASLQVIVVANSGLQAYIDNVRWFLN